MSSASFSLEEIFSEEGFHLDEDQLGKFSLYLKELLRWNRVHNLVGEKNKKDIVLRHFVDSLTLARCFEDLGIDWRGKELADVGSGAGFPGVPLKIYLKDLELTLIESSSKKCSFLEFLKLKIGERYRVICRRAEEVRKKFYIVVARALGKFEKVAPLLEDLSSRYVFVMKGRELREKWLQDYGYRVYRVEVPSFKGSFILWKEVSPPSR